MKKASAIFIVVLIVGLLCPVMGSATLTPEYGAPIDLPENEFAADPSVILVDGVYYMYPTTDFKTIQCWRSEDFETWEWVGPVWGPAPEGAWNDDKLWAPDVFVYGDKFYMYYTANTRIGVAVSDSPEGPFEDVYDHPFIGYNYGNTAFNSIDAHVFEDDDGQLYIYTTCYLPWSSIRVSRMSDPVTLQAPWEILFMPGIVNWELFVCEGPWMIHHDGLYYLMYSGNGANLPLYAVGYAVGETPMGPFVKYSHNPIFYVDWDNEIYGPGHNSVVQGPDGELWAFYHTKVGPDISWDRVIRKNRIGFDENGVLYFDLYRDDAPDDDDDDSGDEQDDADSDDSEDEEDVRYGCA